MKFWVGITDDEWYTFLATLRPDEVNFWRPGGQSFGAIDVGAPFLFKLHSPRNFIVGGGFFVRSEQLPLSLAWDAFREKNGAPDATSVARLIARRRGRTELDPTIGCIVLNQPFFLPEAAWIPAPGSWQGVQTGRSYDDATPAGRELWGRVEPWLPATISVEWPSAGEPMVAEGAAPFYGAEYLRRARLGQGAFRVLVTAAYTRRCAVSAERTLPVLQASHIKPFGQGPNRVDNGLLLRSDLHILFDRGYVTVTPDLRVEVSPKLREEFENGRDYYRYHGQELQNLPVIARDKPNEEFLSWHNENVFRGR